MKIAFLGTPDFALPSLKMLIDSGHEICVFTQPDKPVGRKAVMTPPAVKVMALEYKLKVFQFAKISSDEGKNALEMFAPELMVTAAFGQILSEEILKIPQYGCINVHASLLPKYRGAAPIQWAIINGDEKTGVTTMLTDVGLDTGDILLSKEIAIEENETAGELFSRLAELGAEVLKETVTSVQNGTLIRKKQDESIATRCSMIKKENGHIDFSKGVKAVHNLVRGVNPWPGAYAYLSNEEQIKIWETRKSSLKAEGKPGECVIANEKEGLFVNAGDGLIEITQLQMPGSKRMDAKTFLRGHSLKGQVLK